ncbi:ADP-ribosylation factor-like protein 6-interacting protein 4 [Macrobrachium nipponense]|uniref:ADP-ribosylation factor-like protein 6-interacting protein 4 n=1 Tax=Macrobrachium nipponense TaxID=159736 RepID=UPI0030C81E6C
MRTLYLHPVESLLAAFNQGRPSQPIMIWEARIEGEGVEEDEGEGEDPYSSSLSHRHRLSPPSSLNSTENGVTGFDERNNSRGDSSKRHARRARPHAPNAIKRSRGRRRAAAAEERVTKSRMMMVMIRGTRSSSSSSNNGNSSKSSGSSSSSSSGRE